MMYLKYLLTIFFWGLSQGGMTVRSLYADVGAPSVWEVADYTNYTLLRINPTKSPVQLKKILHIKDKYQLDFWSGPSLLYVNQAPILTHVAPHLINPLKQELLNLAIKYKVLDRNLEELIQAQQPKLDYSERSSDYYTDLNLNEYHNMYEVLAHLKELPEKHPQVQVVKYGSSGEGRPLLAVQLTNEKFHKPGKLRRIAVLECGSHAREWISTAACLQLVGGILTNPKKAKILATFGDIHVIPIADPDGYLHTWEVDRLWSRNETTQPLSREPLMNYLANLTTASSKVEAYFSVRAFNQRWMYPVSEPLEALAHGAVEAISAAKTGTVYQYGPINKFLSPAGVSSVEWVYNRAGVPVVFALELRDRGQYGFLLPPSQIRPTTEELWYGTHYVLNEIIKSRKS